jgi:hypothetical protein
VYSRRGSGPVNTMSSNPDISAGVDAAWDAAVEALADAMPENAEVRLMLIAAVGDPADRADTQVRLAASGGTTTSETQKVAMVMATLKAIAPALYQTMMAGLDGGRSSGPSTPPHRGD